MTSHFPRHRVAGLAVTTVAALVLILVLSFVIGLPVQTSPGRRLREALEWRILGKLPGYVVPKSMLTGSAGLRATAEAVALGARAPALEVGKVGVLGRGLGHKLGNASSTERRGHRS